MANRRPLVQNAEGYFEENVTGDTLQPFGPIDLQSTYKVIGLASASANGDALAYGQSSALLNGLNVNSQLITNVLTPSAGTDAANKNYVDSVATGLDLKASVRVSPTADFSAYVAAGSGVGATLTSADDNVSHNTQDGVALAVGNRLLIATKGGNTTTPNADNGIYVVTTLADGAGQALVLTRATDFDQNAEVTAGAFTFVTEGTANADSGWVLVTNDPITVDTTTLQFTQFSSTVAYTFDQGLSNTAGSIKVELDTAAGAQTAGAGGGSSGLEFDANTAAGKVRAAVNATGGLERSASGLAVLLNGTTLQSAAGGLSVKGLPSLFEINAIATGASVTAANLTDVTDGGDASSLHTHANSPLLAKVMTAVEAFSAFDPVAQSTTSGKIWQARANSDPRAKVKGVAMAASAGDNSTALVVVHGTAAGALSGATPGAIYYVGATGGLTATVPGSGNRVIQVGQAETATDLWVQILDYGKKAA